MNNTGKESAMKSPTKVLITLTCLSALTLLIALGCSDNPGVSPFETTELTGSDNDGGNDEIGPQDDTDDEFQMLNFTFDEGFNVTTKTVEKMLYASGGSITIEVDGQNRIFTFPPRMTESVVIHSVTVSKGINLNGENLELFSLEPEWVTYTGSISVELETDVKSVASSLTDPQFTLYRLFGGTYIKHDDAKSDTEGTVSFELVNGTDYAVTYKGMHIDDDIPLN